MDTKLICQNSLFILISSIGGYLLSLTGMAIGWMIGTLIVSGLISFWKPAWMNGNYFSKGINPNWRYAGQAIIGIQLGQQINPSIASTFTSHWMTITIMLLLSIGFALLSGFFLWRLTKSDLMTSLLGTTPGGVSAMPTIAEEAGANTITVSIVQLIRIFLVVSAVPLVAFYFEPSAPAHNDAGNTAAGVPGTGPLPVLIAFLLIIGSFAGHRIGKKIKLPAPWLVGGMLGAGAMHILCSSVIGPSMAVWWPHWLIIIAQVLIGASIGSRLHKEMFKGAREVVIVGLITSICLVGAMAVCSFGVSALTHLSLVTSILAFAPGGVAEMATASVAYKADSAFVVAVQTLRLVLIFLLLPPLFRVLIKIENKSAPKQDY
ncbi:AbrB family transcriptional regulator [Metabacillus sp. RGM 3146]|uniref:AbrB family transcriptional regulator n=1 Tax=Metabacillus sp. RGM 3146 TaxID=3401092 RepID=UPI003B9BCD11